MATLTLTPSGAADAAAFLTRLRRLDPAALVRIRPAPSGAAWTEERRERSDEGPRPARAEASAGLTALWARLPWGVLVTRTVAGSAGVDATVPAGELIAALGPGEVTLPSRHDAAWRWALPSGGGRTVEVLPAAQVRRLGHAAEQTVREAASDGVAGRAVGERAVRDALLDHEAIVVHATVTNSTVERIAVPQRLVQAVMRMGFLRSTGDSPEPLVRIIVAGRFVGLAAEYGVAWYQKSVELTIQSIV